MPKLIIDLNSVLSASILVGKDPEGILVGDVLVNSWGYGYDIFLHSLKNTLQTLNIVPRDIVGVFDTPNSRQKRQNIFPEYKKHRKERLPEYYQEFNTLLTQTKKFIKELGGGLVSVKGMEADDVIAHIAPKLDAIIWSRDKDLLAIDTPMWLDNNLYELPICEDKFGNIPRKYIKLYRSLVSDPGDFGPGMGAQGFGHKSFLKLAKIFGDTGLDLLIELILDRNLAALTEDVAEFSLLQKIIDSQDNVYLTWELAQWINIKDHQLIFDFGYVHTSKCETFDTDFADYYGYVTLVTADNFEQMARQIKYLATESDYITIDIETDIPPESKEWLAKIKQKFSRPPIQVDVFSSYLVGFSLTLGANSQNTFYISVRHFDTPNVTSSDVKKLLMSLDKPFIAHNAGGFELPVLYNEWHEWLPDVYCSQIAAKYVDENSRTGLKFLSKKWFDYTQTEYTEVTKGKGMSELTAAHVLDYGADDTIMTAALFNLFELILDIEGTFSTYAEVEQKPMYAIARAFCKGVPLNLSELAKLEKDDFKQYERNMAVIHTYLIDTEWPGAYFIPLVDFSAKELKRGFAAFHGAQLKTGFRKIEKLAKLMQDLQLEQLVLDQDLEQLNNYLAENFTPNISFKPGSSLDKAKLIYDIMGAPVRFRKPVTETQRKLGHVQGNRCADEDSIRWAMQDVGTREKEVLTAVLRCLGYLTRNGLYYQAYPHLVHWKDKKLHPNLRQSATTSRRFAPSGPNVNQLPKRSDDGKKIRQCITPHHKNALIVSADFSGQELRIAAEVTQDANLLACYEGENAKDPHSETAYAISQRQGCEFNSYAEFIAALNDDQHSLHALAKQYRTTKAKPTNFLSQYITVGGGVKTLSKKLRITEQEADIFLNAKAAAFPGIDKWKIKRGAQIRRQGYAETLLGARKHIHRLLHTMDADYVLRSAINFEIQGPAAEMTKLVLATNEEVKLCERYDAAFYFPVHDEVIFSVGIPDIPDFCKELQKIMVQPYANMQVPLASSLSIGPNFGSLKDVAWDAVPEFFTKRNFI